MVLQNWNSFQTLVYGIILSKSNQNTCQKFELYKKHGISKVLKEKKKTLKSSLVSKSISFMILKEKKNFKW